jgi:biopolymer transport protein ExbB
MLQVCLGKCIPDDTCNTFKIYAFRNSWRLIYSGRSKTVDIISEFRKGGLAMYPLLVLSVLTVSVVFERLWFWLRILNQERQIVARVLDAATENWGLARDIAQRATNQPIGRFLYAPLSLPKADAETFRLALEASAEDELSGMRRGDKLLEAAIALAPLLGLYGTVSGLVQALKSIRIGDLAEPESISKVTSGIGESLISTAAGLIVAIVSLMFYRFFQALIANQVRIFQRAGNDLELLYRQSPPNYNEIMSYDPGVPTVENYPNSENFGTQAALPAPDTTTQNTKDSFNYPRRRGKSKLGEPHEPPAESNPADSEKP